MAILLIGLSALACFLTSGTTLFGPAIANAVASVWANGVITNFSSQDSDAVPNWAAGLSALTALISVGLIIYGVVT